jgi:hypothetical protein
MMMMALKGLKIHAAVATPPLCAAPGHLVCLINAWPTGHRPCQLTRLTSATDEVGLAAPLVCQVPGRAGAYSPPACACTPGLLRMSRW